MDQEKSPSAGDLAGAGDLLALARSTDTTLTAPIPGSDEALALEQQQAAAPKLSVEQEITGAFAMLGAGVGRFLPSVGKVLDEPTSAELGRVLAPLAVKYNLVRFFDGFAWRAEAQAAMIVLPVGFALADGIRADIAELRRRKAEAERGAPDPAAAAAALAGASSQPAPNSAPAPLGMLQPIERPS